MCLRFIVKYVLFLFNLIFVIIGAALIALGTFIHFKFDEIQNTIPEELNIDITLLPIVVIVTGCVIFLIAFSGCCGAINESKCLLIIYACIMCVLAAAKIYVVVTLLQNANVYREKLETSVNNAFVDPNFNTTFHAVEHMFKCCGTTGAGSYDGISEYLPPTCCDGVLETCMSVANSTDINIETVIESCLCEQEDAYEDGCTTLLGEYFAMFAKYTGYGFITIIAIEVLATVFAVYVITSIKKHKR